MIECLGRFGFSKVLKKSFNDFFCRWELLLRKP